MILIEKEITQSDFNIILCGDIHQGNKLVHRSGVESLINNINKKNTYFVFMGDATESITPRDKRYDLDTSESTTPLEQAGEIIDMFKPVRKKCLVWLTGNHESKVDGLGNLVKGKICHELGIPYGTFSCRLTLVNNNASILFSSYFHHGAGQLTAQHPDPFVCKSMLAYKLKQKLESFGGDCLLNAMGHIHKLITYRPSDELYMVERNGDIKSCYTSKTIFNNNTSYINPQDRWYVSTGGFLKLYGDIPASGYAERGMLRPVELGYQVVRVENGTITDIRKVLV